jgi:hypothetical protein
LSSSQLDLQFNCAIGFFVNFVIENNGAVPLACPIVFRNCGVIESWDEKDVGCLNLRFNSSRFSATPDLLLAQSLLFFEVTHLSCVQSCVVGSHFAV